MNIMPTPSATQRPAMYTHGNSSPPPGHGKGWYQTASALTHTMPRPNKAIVLTRDRTVAEMATGASMSRANGLLRPPVK